MFNWLKNLFSRNEAPPKKKSKRNQSDFTLKLTHQAAKKIGDLTPLLLARMSINQDEVVLDYCYSIDIIRKTGENELTLRIAPNSPVHWARYFYVKYDSQDLSLSVIGVSDNQNGGIYATYDKKQGEASAARVEILKAALGEVIFEYERGFADDLVAIASALQVADRIQRGLEKKSTRKPTINWIT